MASLVSFASVLLTTLSPSVDAYRVQQAHHGTSTVLNPTASSQVDANKAEIHALVQTSEEGSVRAGCKVTTHDAGNCGGSAVETYSTYSASGQEWKWSSGYQENKPVSASIEGECTSVEFYDEDSNEGYSDNIIRKATGCFNLPWDLEQDLGGLKVFATVIKCSANQRVVSHSCKACPAGTVNAAQDDALGADTTCDTILCSANQHVAAHACQVCPAGTRNVAGNDASGADTTCDAITCSADQRVVAHACEACPAGTDNAGGDDASGADTTCDAILCSANQQVDAHVCQVCPAGTKNVAGDDASGADTTCDAIHCAKNQHVKANACHTCPLGTTNADGNDASGADTTCDPTHCAANNKVVSNECRGCPPGKANEKGDDASGEDSVCDAIKCAENQRVQDNACVSCPADSRNAAGDDASGSDTTCRSPCKVTTHTADNCRGFLVATYSTYDAASGQEWKWSSGNQENAPVSARIVGECTKVEFYDEDMYEGYSDNIIKRTNGCFNLPWDLKQDLGGVKVFAKVGTEDSYR